MSKSLLEAAVLEAKQVRAATIENAKQTVYESITPHIKQMLAAKLEEEFDTEDEEPIEEATDSGFTKVKVSTKPVVKEAEEGDEIPEDEPEEAGDEGEDVEKAEPETGEEGAEEEPEGEDLEGETEDPEDDRDISDLSVEEFKTVIRDIIASEIELKGGAGEEEASLGDDMDGGEVEGMGEEEPSMDMGIDDEVDVEDEEDSDKEGSSNFKDEDEEEIDISEVLKELENAPKTKVEDPEKDKLKQDLQEAYQVIDKLRTNLKETSLLNSKLLFLNKVLDKNNLTEEQKVKVISVFDKATSIKEVKLVFEALEESFNKEPKKPVLRENRGSASQATGMAPKRPQILAEDTVVARWQKLAGITKN